MSLVVGQKVAIPFAINQVDTLAGTSAELIAPADGFVNALFVTVQVGVTTGGEVKVAVGTTDVHGAAVTVANGATKGTRYSASATKRHPSREVKKGDRIQVIPHADFATAGAVSGFVEFSTGA